MDCAAEERRIRLAFSGTDDVRAIHAGLAAALLFIGHAIEGNRPLSRGGRDVG